MGIRDKLMGLIVSVEFMCSLGAVWDFSGSFSFLPRPQKRARQVTWWLSLLLVVSVTLACIQKEYSNSCPVGVSRVSHAFSQASPPVGWAVSGSSAGNGVLSSVAVWFQSPAVMCAPIFSFTAVNCWMLLLALDAVERKALSSFYLQVLHRNAHNFWENEIVENCWLEVFFIEYLPA